MIDNKNILDDNDLNRFDLNQIEAELCKESLFYFVQSFWETFDTSKPIWNFHIKYLCYRLQDAGLRLIREEKKLKDILVAMPPGIGKSNIISILFPAWLWTLKPSLKIIGASYSKSISSRDLAFKAKQVIESQKYRDFFPYIKINIDKSAESDFHNNHMGSRFASSVDSGITGKRGDLLIVDDPLNMANVYSQKDRDSTNDYVDNLSTRKVSAEVSLTIIAQQRLHREDTIGHILSQDPERTKNEYICLPAEYHRSLQPISLKKFYDAQKGLLFPERYSLDTLEDERRKSLRTYNAQFLQSPSDDSLSLLKESFFPFISHQEFKSFPTTPVDFFCDTASTTNRKKNDPTVILSACKIGNFLYITGMSRVWKEIPKAVEYIKNYVSLNSYTDRSRIFIEPAASGFAIYQYLHQDSTLNVLKSQSQNKLSKTERLEMVAPTLSAQRVILVRGEWNKDFIGEVCVPESEHDDVKDALIMCVSELLLKKKGSGKYHITFT